MASLQIPERYKAGFLVLARLSTPSYEEFVAAVKTAPNKFVSIRELEVWIASEVKTIPATDVAKLIESITSAYRLLARNPGLPSKIAGDLFDAARDGIPGFQLANDVDFVGRLVSLLELKSLDVVELKAKELQLQAERLFCEAKVLTDVRPIFAEQIGDPPTSAIVIHTLKIVYHEMMEHREFFVALDTADIAALKKVLERAEEKSRSIATMMDERGLRSIELK